MKKCTFTLKACRVNKNLTIADVAESIGKTGRTIINWEKYETTPDASDLRTLSILYGVPEDVIFLGDKYALSKHYSSDEEIK